MFCSRITSHFWPNLGILLLVLALFGVLSWKAFFILWLVVPLFIKPWRWDDYDRRRSPQSLDEKAKRQREAIPRRYIRLDDGEIMPVEEA